MWRGVERETVKTTRLMWTLVLMAGLGCAFGGAWAQDDPPPDEAEAGVEEIDDSEAGPPPPPEEDQGGPPPAPRRPSVMPQRVRPKPARPVRPSPKAAPAATSNNNSNNLPKDGSSVTEPVSFDFKEVQLGLVIEQIARITGKNFDIDPNITSVPVTVITHDDIPPELAYQVLEAILASRGFSLMEMLDGHLIKVVKTGESLDKTPFGRGMDPLAERYDTLETHVVNLESADAGELTAILMKLGSGACSIDAYVPTNTLILTDTTDGLKRIFTFIEEVDIPGFETLMEIFTLEYTRAEVLSTQIEQVLSPDGTGGGAPTTTSTSRTPTRPVRPTRPTVPGRDAPLTVGSREEVLRIVPDERLNALIVVATEGMMERVRDLVLKLDTPTPYEANNLHVYELLNADAEQVESALNTLVGTTPRKAGQAGATGGAEIQPFEKKVMLTRYEQTNALLILASPQDYKLIEEVIAQLDVPTRQVHIEVVIMEVAITDNFTLNVETALFQNDTHGVTGLNNVVNLANLLTSGPLSVAGTGLTAGYLDGTTEITTTGSEGELTTMTVPNVPLLISAMENMTDIDVLSQPSLTTRDNEDASIVVGQEVPVPTQRSGYSYGSSTSDTTPRYTGLTSYGSGISREDVGVKMTATPHINEGDYVSTEVTIEVSQTVNSDVGIDANELGPTFQKSEIENNVVVKDGSTGIIGGLISETTDHSRRQTPVLGDVPVLGWFFRSRGSSRTKRNLVVLLTPHIVKEGVELERLTTYRMNEFRDYNVDVLFEEGFIKKVKRKHEVRTKHRPGTERSEQYESRSRFGRGDIQR